MANYSEKQRVDWIDRAKGIGAILVIFGHLSYTPLWWKTWLYSFHMPLFFFLSGLTYNHSKYKSTKSFFIDKTKALMIPYCIFALLLLLWDIIKEIGKVILIQQPIKASHFLYTVTGVVVNIRNTDYSGVGLWFIPCIFITFCILYIILKITKRRPLIIFVTSCFCLTAGYVYGEFVDIKLPWGIDAAFVAVFFMLSGYLAKNRLYKSIKFKPLDFICGGILLVCNVFATALNTVTIPKVDMWNNDYGNIIFFVIAAVGGIMFVVLLANTVFARCLTYVGKYSLYIYGTHMILISFFNKVYSVIPWKLNGIIEFVIASVSVVIIIVILLILVKYYLRIVKWVSLNFERKKVK